MMNRIALFTFCFSLMLSFSALAKELSKAEAVEKALDKYPGKLLSASAEQGKKGKVYHIKLVTKDGRVKRVKVDANSGKVY